MKPKIALLFLAVIFVAILTACGRQATSSPLVGIWQSEHTVLEFNSDGTGTETREGRNFEFSWIEDDGILTFGFTHDAEGSAINALMQAVLHGAQVESFGFYFSDDGDELTITDDHGHGHFRLILTRTDYVGEVSRSPQGENQSNDSEAAQCSQADTNGELCGDNENGITNDTEEPFRATLTPEDVEAAGGVTQARYPELGIRTRVVLAGNDTPEFEFLKLVIDVAPNTAGSAAGFLVGDLILTQNGEPAAREPRLPQFRDMFVGMELTILPDSGEDLVFRILRDGAELELTAYIE